MGLKILVAPTGFKESLEPHIAADCIERGILRAGSNAKVQKVPLVDGGEGFARALVAAWGGELRHLTVTGPVNTHRVESYYGLIAGQGGRPKTAVVEMAAAAGLRLVPKDMRDPTVTTTYGVGELILAAVEDGAQHIVVGCGDSGTTDGGVGMCQALGVRFLDCQGRELPRASGGQALKNLAEIDMSHLHPRLRRHEVSIDALCNWKNILCGPSGVARVYGPQKGATHDQVQSLSSSLETYAQAVTRKLGVDVSHMPGSGASGGLGTGLLLLRARLRPRFDAITEYFGLDNLFTDCQLVFTAEGGIDSQTPRGKIPSEVALRAKKHGIPVIALAGTIGSDADVNYTAGIDAFTSIVQGPTSLEDAVGNAEQLLTDCAERAMRMVSVGRTIQGAPHPSLKQGSKSAVQSVSFLKGGRFPRAMYLGLALFILCCFQVFCW